MPLPKKITESNWLKPKKFRVLLAWFGLSLLFFYAHTSDTGFRIGIPLVVLGELIRVWAGGFQEQKGKVLITNGPYAFTRNPLYLGNFLIGFGCVLIVRNLVLLAIFFIGFFWVHSKVMEKEERELLNRFGPVYQRYLNEVPRFIPRFSPYPNRTKADFQLKYLWKQREYLTLIGIAVLLGGMYAWGELVVEKEKVVSEKVAVTFAVLAFLIISAFVEWLFRASGRFKNNSHTSAEGG